MKILYICAVCIATFVLIAALTWTICRIVDEKPVFHWQVPYKNYIRYSTFLTLYAITPEKWYIDYSDCSVKYNYEWFFMASLIDLFKMWRFCKKKKKEDRLKQHNESMEKYLKMWQQDIEDFKKKGTNNG